MLKNERFTLEGSQKFENVFPMFRMKRMFVLLMEHGKHFFEMDLAPTVNITLLKRR